MNLGEGFEVPAVLSGWTGLPLAVSPKTSSILARLRFTKRSIYKKKKAADSARFSLSMKLLDESQVLQILSAQLRLTLFSGLITRGDSR